MKKGLIACALLSILGILMWRMPNQPQAADITMPGAKFNALSYAPYQAWQSPASKSYPTGTEVASDLKLVATEAMASAPIPRSRAITISAPWPNRPG